MSDSKEGEPGSLEQVNGIANSLFGDTQANEENKSNDEKKEDTSGGTENKEEAPAEDNPSKTEENEINSDKEVKDNTEDNNEKAETTETNEDTKETTEEQDKSKLEDQLDGLAGALTTNDNSEEKKEEAQSQDEKGETSADEPQENKEKSETEGGPEAESEKEKSETTEGEKDKSETETTEGEKDKSETETTEGEKDKSETEGDKEKSETTEGDKETEGDTDKTENDTDAEKGGLDSTLTGTLGDLTGTLTGDNENKNETENETDNTNDNQNEDDENSSPPVHEPSERKSSTTPRRSTRSYYDTQTISYKSYPDDELQQALDALIKNNKAPEEDMVPALRKYIESEMTEAALNQKYEYGLQLEKATNTLNQVTAVDPEAIKSETKRREAEERHATAKENYDNSVKEWEERIAEYRKEQDKRISELEQEHKRQMNEFEEQWSKPENMLEYNKPSSQYIRLRTTEQNLALQKNFGRAKDVKAQADRLLREEQAEAQRRAVADMRLAYEALDLRQRREMECLLQHTQSTIDSMERERDKCIIPMSQIVKRHKENSRPKTVRGSGNKGLADTARSSPRPIRTKMTATTIRPAIGLGINGIDVKQYIKPKKPTTSTTAPGSPRK